MSLDISLSRVRSAPRLTNRGPLLFETAVDFLWLEGSAEGIRHPAHGMKHKICAAAEDQVRHTFPPIVTPYQNVSGIDDDERMKATNLGMKVRQSRHSIIRCENEMCDEAAELLTHTRNPADWKLLQATMISPSKSASFIL